MRPNQLGGYNENSDNTLITPGLDQLPKKQGKCICDTKKYNTMRECMHVNVCMYMYMYMYMYICVCMYMYVCMYVCMYVYC